MEKKAIFSLVVIFLMVASIFGATLEYFSKQKGTDYNGFEFKQSGQQYKTQINDKDYFFLVFPGDLEYITIPDEAKSALAQRVITVTYDPQSTINQSLAGAQFYIEQQTKDVKIIDLALTNNTGTMLLEKTCLNATASQPVIQLEQSNESKITFQNNCVRIQALDDYDLLQQTERTVYQMLGIMK